MITENELKDTLAKILNSGEFHESKRHQDLLTYLAHESLKPDPIKETTIAHDVFGQGADFDPGKDTIVRSYISTLRKKLEHYYLTTEDSYKFKLEIPKGHYVVNFIPQKRTDIKKHISPYIYISVIFVLAVLIILITVLFIIAKAKIKNLPVVTDNVKILTLTDTNFQQQIYF